MSPDRKNRTSDEVTVDFVTKRFSNEQLLVLVGLREYKNWQPKLLERLQPTNNLGLDNFKKVHPNNSCEVVEADTGEDLRVGGVDIDIGRWSSREPIKQLICKTHGVASVEFINWATQWGKTVEGPFDHTSKIKS